MKSISVILPVSHAGERLQPMLDSMRTQDFWDFEVLLLADSNAYSLDAVRRIEQQDERFHCFIQEHSGAAAAYHRGMQLAEGKYLALLHMTDRIAHNYLSALYNACENENADAACCTVAVEQGGQAVWFSMAEEVLGQRQALEQLLMRRGIYGGVCGKLYRRTRLAGLRFSADTACAELAFQAEFFTRALCVAITEQTVCRHRQENTVLPEPDLLVITQQLLRLIEQRHLSAQCFYHTISYPMRYARGMGGRTADANEYLRRLRRLIQQNRWKICRAFPRREALTLLAFSCGYPVNRERRKRNGGSSLWTRWE